MLLVTGGTGFIAAHIVQAAVDAGLQVATTVRPGKTPEQLRFFADRGVTVREADLLDAESWREAVKGCTCVIHTASPFKLAFKDALNDVVRPAVQGTENVLQACLDEPSVERVVITSSSDAVVDDHSGDPERVYTEEDWNDAASIADNAYQYSKVKAEEAAWKFVGIHADRVRFTLCTVLPVGVFGPPLLLPSRPEAVNTSNQLLLKVLNRDYPAYPKFFVPGIDVRDVAAIHLGCARSTTPAGRYLAVADTVSFAQVADWVRLAHPATANLIPAGERTLPNALVVLASLFDPSVTVRYVYNAVGEQPARFDNAKTTTAFQLEYTPLARSFADAAVAFAEADGLLTVDAIREALRQK